MIRRGRGRREWVRERDELKEGMRCRKVKEKEKKTKRNEKQGGMKNKRERKRRRRETEKQRRAQRRKRKTKTTTSYLSLVRSNMPTMYLMSLNFPISPMHLS